MDGYLLVDKPEGPSSFDVVRIARRVVGVRKIGHCGTLDPLASGLLILAVGIGTRLLPYLRTEPKRYRFTVTFGRTTATLDREGEVTSATDIIPSEEMIRLALPAFAGEIEQRPPAFSAIRVKGQRAYKLARRHEPVELPPRVTNIHSLSLVEYAADRAEATLDLLCSSGTYVRSLARDIAEKAGSLGFASSIRRIGAGDYVVDDALTVEQLQESGKSALLPLTEMFSGRLTHTATPDQLSRLAHGSDILVEATAKAEDTLFLLSPEGVLVAVAERVSGNQFHPQKVFAAQ